MSAEATIISEAIKAQLSSDAILSSYVKKFTLDEDLDFLVRERAYPFVDISSYDLRIREADNMRLFDYERHIYSVVIRFCVGYNERSVAANGDGKKRKGIWELFEDIKRVIDTDLSFGGVVTPYPYVGEAGTAVQKYLDQTFWLGKGALTFDVVKDICKR